MRFPAGACLFLALAKLLTSQDDAVANAVSALQNGDLPAAEQILQSELIVHPNDGPALEVMGAVLDQEKKYVEADAVYLRALKAPTPSPGLLNNYGNHLLAMGKTKEAHAAFAKVLSTVPRHPNAAVQMARLDLEERAPAEASRYLEQLPADVLDRPEVVLLRIRAGYALHHNSAADSLVARASAAADNNPQQTLALAEALSAAGRNDQAEALFVRTLELEPQNFDALYELGLAAAHAGHQERAREVLERALEKQPENPGVLYDLAAVDLNLNRGEASLELLARARKIAPDRADVQLLLARTAAQLGYFGDAVQAWEWYLALKPHDEVARREHAFAEMALGVNGEAALADLRAYTRKHPEDPAGHYELGVAESPGEPDQALPELARALALKPQFAAAHLVRGLVLYRQGKLQAALSDFEKGAAEEPRNPDILERLGQNDLALGRTADALRVLRQAETIAPTNGGVLLQLGHALEKSGEETEAAKIFARYREVRTRQQGVPHPAGLVDFLSLSPGEQMARYRAGVERTVEKSPDNVDAQVRYLGLLLSDGTPAEAESALRKIEALQPNAAALADTAQELLDASRFQDAKEILQHAEQRGITSSDLKLDLALAIDRLDGAEASLEVLNRTATGERTGDYYLALAQVLGEAKRSPEADQALTAALKANPARAPLYHSAALSLLQRELVQQALHVLQKGIENIPQDPQLRVMRAVAFTMAGRNSDDEFQQIENRWPEWAPAWIADAFVRAINGQTKQAGAALETARVLGATGPAVDLCATEIERGAAASSDRRARLLGALHALFG